jgi:hypothetical protein
MNRKDIFLFLLFPMSVAGITATALASCGSDDSNPKSNVVDDFYEENTNGKWIATTDPNTGKAVSCYVIYMTSDRGHNGGPAMWCYQP